MNDEGPEAADVFAQLAVELHEEGGVDETVEAVLQFALQAVSCKSAGVLLVQLDGRLETLAATDDLVEQCDRLQIETGTGPARETMDEDTVLIADTAADERWPVWSAKTAALGLGSLLCVRLHAGGITLGVLQLFAAEPDTFDADDDAVAHILARHASVALASARQEESLWQAIDARKLIGQAQGILMERFGIDDGLAFTVLRRYSQDYNLKLRDVAQRLIDTRRLPD
ncbi:GAF domain-containing protein [Kribbella amoyensis]|uniref:GAF domain-containing protein n=1 Tax=Kribbella amoyensis TaxID=996641 RepID=A0A561BR76_9ACTN|nr:GAF and ANTAR domain-containing protein [Kribbella amoyensis]TWD81263.1 GAF domain-containing protein [Kribbella amoyensis]